MRTFIFDYQKDIEPLDNDIALDYKDYKITILATTGLSEPVTAPTPFILRVQNPCSEMANIAVTLQPSWCPSDSLPFWDPNMPPWMKQLHDVTIEVGDSFSYEFGAAVNRYNQPMNVMMRLDKTRQFSFFDKERNSYNVLNVTIADLGYWRLLVIS